MSEHELNTRLSNLEGKFETEMEHNRRWQDDQGDKTQRILDKLDSYHTSTQSEISAVKTEVAETRGRDRNLALFGSVGLSVLVAWLSKKVL